jgi:hypothetical protein
MLWETKYAMPYLVIHIVPTDPKKKEFYKPQIINGYIALTIVSY